MSAEGGLFISYASADRVRVEPIVADLTARVRCWFDRRELKPFDAQLTERINEGIASTSVTMAFVSAAYQGSPACRYELIRTLQTSGLQGLLLVRLDNCEAEWTIVQENISYDLSNSRVTGVLDRLGELDPPIGERPARGLPVEGGPDGWTSNAFDGRFDERLRLISWLTPHIGDPDRHTGRGRQAQIVGLGGQGKSMLAMQCATDLAHMYPGGILRLNAGGDMENGRVTNAASTLDRLLRQVHDWAHEKARLLDMEVDLPSRSDKKVWARTRTAIAPLVDGTLWLIDDLPAGLDEDAFNRILCPSPGHSLITSRSAAYRQHLPHSTLTLDALSKDEAVYILAYGEAKTIERDGPVLEEIASEVGRYALALAVLRPRLASVPARVLLHNLRHATVGELEDCAQDLDGLPAGHEASVVATLRMSVAALRHQQSVDILRLAAVWPRGMQMPLDMIKTVIGTTVTRGATELVTANLAQKEDDGLKVHAIVAALADWLMTNDPDSVVADAVRVSMLRGQAAEWLRPVAEKDKDPWDASDAGHTAWHLLEPVDVRDWSESDQTSAYFALMAMARLPMQHPPAEMKGSELAGHITTAIGWAERASRIFPAEGRQGSLRVGRALAMQGLLEMSLAESVANQRERVSHASRGRALLDESVRLREPWLIGSQSRKDQDELDRAYYNYGRLVSLAKALALTGDHRECVEALDQAERTYVRIGIIRKENIGTDVDDAGPEKLASCLRGEAIVALTRVTHQAHANVERRRQWLAHASERLGLSMEQTCSAAVGATNATPDMCKDVALAIKIDVVSRILDEPSIDATALLADLTLRVEETPVPWTAPAPPEKVDAASGLARLRISTARQGKGITAGRVIDDLVEQDLPALLRTLSQES